MKTSKMLLMVVFIIFTSILLTQGVCFADSQSKGVSWEECNEQPCWVLQERNLRCVGGFTGDQGRIVVPKLLFRSASLGNLTADELNTLLNDMKLKSIVDFRTTVEIVELPEEVALTDNLIYYSLPIDSGPILEEQPNGHKLLDYMDGKITLEELGDLSKIAGNWYPDMVVAFAEKFREFFSLISEPDNLPLLFHCSAGKDRTGIATALTLKLLGVAEDVIMTDYMASWNPAKSYVVYPEWLQPVFNAVNVAGGIEPYLRNVVGVNAEIQLKIKQNFTQDNTVLLRKGSPWYYNSLGKYNFADIFLTSAGIIDHSWKQFSFDLNNKAWTFGHSLGFSPFGLDSLYATVLPYSLPFGELYPDEIEKMYKYIEKEFGPLTNIDIKNGKFITYYFRQMISAPTLSSNEDLQLNILADDGFVLYINDYEALRWNMPEGEINHFTLALRSVDPEWKTFYISNQYLHKGNNIIAIEVHQSSSDSSDLVFDLELSRASYEPAIVEIITDLSTSDLLPKIFIEVRQNNTTQNYISLASDSKMSLRPGTYDIVVHADGYASSTYMGLSLEAGETISLGILFHEEQKIFISGDTWQYWPSIPLDIDFSDIQVEKMENLQWLSEPSSIIGWASIQTPLSEFDVPDYKFKFYDIADVPQVNFQFVGNVLRLYKNFVFDSTYYNQLPYITFRFRTDIGDGLFVYFNGSELSRYNIDANESNSDITVGSRTKIGDGPSGWQEVQINSSLLNRFSNMFAIDIRQPKGSLSANYSEKNVIDILEFMIDQAAPKESAETVKNKFIINDTIVKLDASAESILPGGWQKIISISTDLYFDAELLVPSYIEIYPYFSNNEVDVVLNLVDETGKIISDASILINDKEIKTGYSNSNYTFKLFPGDYELKVKHSNYVNYCKSFLLTALSAQEKKINAIVYTNQWEPPYNGRKFEEPQVLIAGFSPSVAKDGDIITTWAIVRQGRKEISSVVWHAGSTMQLKKKGMLFNGDELWTTSFMVDEAILNSKEPFLSIGGNTVSAIDSIGLTSPLFPALGQSDFAPLIFPENSQCLGNIPLEYSLNSTSTSAPQLVGCGSVPSFMNGSSEKVQLIAVVRKGDAQLDYVIWQDDSSAVTLLAEQIGQFPNGDLIYSITIDASSLSTDILSSGNTFMAVDINGSESNVCFEIKSD